MFRTKEERIKENEDEDEKGGEEEGHLVSIVGNTLRNS